VYNQSLNGKVYEQLLRGRETKQEMTSWYQNLTNDIRALKNRQWLIVYYCSLVFAGLFGFVKTFDEIRTLGIALITFICVGVTLFGILSITRNQILLTDNRFQTLFIEKYFKIKNVMHPNGLPKFYLTYWYHWYDWLLLKIGIIVGFSLIFWYLNKHYCLITGFLELYKFIQLKKWYIIFACLILGALIVYFIFRARKIDNKQYEKLGFYK